MGENGWNNGEAAMQALKDQVQARFKLAVQRCRHDTSCKREPALVWTLNQPTIEDDEDRQMPWPDGTWAFEKGEQYTMVIIHKALPHGAHAHGGGASDEAAQHLAVTGHYVPAAGQPADYYYILPSTRHEWAWHNSVRWMVTLANNGGSGASDAQWVSAAWMWLLVLVIMGSPGFLLVGCIVLPLKCLRRIKVADRKKYVIIEDEKAAATGV